MAKNTTTKINGIKTKAKIFCHKPEVLPFGIHSSKLKTLQIAVKKLVIKTGKTINVLSFVCFERKESIKSEITNAKNELKSPNHAQAKLDKMLVPKRK